MTVSVRTNRVTNPNVASSSTGWASVAGTGGTASGARNTGAGYAGMGFFRVAWTVATSALSGGFTVTQTGLSAATQYVHQVWVRSSKTQTVKLTAQYKNSSSVDVGSAVSGPLFTLTAGEWARITVAALSGAAVDRVVLTAAATTGGANWANGDTFDGDLACCEVAPVNRTNRSTNPTPSDDTGYSISGGAVGSWAYDTSEAQPFNRFTKDAAAAVATAFNTQAAQTIPASSTVSMRAWVRVSYATTVSLRNDATPITGSATAVAADTWTEITFDGYAPAGTTFRLTMLISGFQPNATFDVKLSLWEIAPTVGTYFDGDTPNAAATERWWMGPVGAAVSVETPSLPSFDGASVNAGSTMFAWTGTANASNSTATFYTPELALVVQIDGTCDRVEITITDLTPTENVVAIWRTADGKRQAVREARRRSIVGSDFVVDYEPPLGRPISYELEVLTGVGTGGPSEPETTIVNATSGWIQDPLDPSSAIPLHGGVGPDGEPALMGQALKSIEYAADVSIIPILGSPEPVALLGQRMAGAGISFAMVTEAAQESTNLRNLIQQAPLLLIRPLPEWAGALPGLCYIAPGKPTELPVDEGWGGNVIRWAIDTPLVAAPTMNILVPIWTYGDVFALWGTYQQAQSTLAGQSYLAVRKSPSGA